MRDTPPMEDLTKTNINLPLKNVFQGWKKAKQTDPSEKKSYKLLSIMSNLKFTRPQSKELLCRLREPRHFLQVCATYM